MPPTNLRRDSPYHSEKNVIGTFSRPNKPQSLRDHHYSIMLRRCQTLDLRVEMVHNCTDRLPQQLYQKAHLYHSASETHNPFHFLLLLLLLSCDLCLFCLNACASSFQVGQYPFVRHSLQKLVKGDLCWSV